VLDEVASLLHHHTQAEAFLADPAIAAVQPLHADALEGSLVGPWRVLGLLGRGGMGVVYLAERADGAYEREVALKVVKRGMDTDAIVDRFLKERQILSGLVHPGIAQFLDAGVTPDGRPYFVMERVEGTTLLHYCSLRRLGLEERLRLFCEVCEAVQYAHANLVVHRDLKPSNILVTDEGKVKLLDFGIAKVLSGDGLAEQTTLTGVGFRPLTPEYAAPEQLAGARITTASDGYSLGALVE
jgi:eukaryotic-like serine/threonine-protein kinase